MFELYTPTNKKMKECYVPLGVPTQICESKQLKEHVSPIVIIIYYFKHFNPLFFWPAQKNEKNCSFISEGGPRKLARRWDSRHKRTLDTQGGHIHDSILLSRKWVAAHASQPQLFSSTSCHGNVLLPSPHILLSLRRQTACSSKASEERLN